jgi:hypothetical protein
MGMGMGMEMRIAVWGTFTLSIFHNLKPGIRIKAVEVSALD